MYQSESKDLAVSVLIYMAAILFGLSLFVVPIYLATRPTVVENAGAPALARAQAIERTAHSDRFPVAHLKEPTLVDPATVAEFNAKVKESDASHGPVRHNEYYRPRPQRSYAEEAPVRQRPSYPNFSTLR
jgi:hypothetical protein